MLKNMPFTVRLFLFIIVMILMTIFIISYSSIRMTKNGLMIVGRKSTIATHQAVFKTVEDIYSQTQPKLTKDLHFFLTLIKAKGTLLVDPYTTSEEKVINQETGETHIINLPEMHLDSEPLLHNNHLVDNATDAMGSIFSVFQIIDNKLLRIASSYKESNKKTIVGTYIPATHQIFKSVSKGDHFIGETTIGGKKIISHYIPLKDTFDNIVGAVSASKPKDILLLDIRKILQKSKIPHGYFFAYNKEGIVIEHPKAKGENLFKIVPETRDTKEGFIDYPYKNRKKTLYTKFFSPAEIFIAVTMRREDIVNGVDKKILRNNILIGITLIIIAIAITLLIVRTINRPLQQLAEKTARVGDGDYTVEFHSNSKDAIGKLIQSLQQMVKNERNTIQNINKSSRSLSSASSELAAISQEMVNNANETTSVSDVAAQNSAMVSDNINSISNAMKQATSNLDTISSSAEEMGNTIKEIANNSARARQTTKEAVESARKSHRDVQKLGEAALSIGSITETITEISEQTNLLSLNATIEAARAGDAGKGFAVVANEIKELAKGTAEATGKIRVAIEAIQNQTSGTVEDISQIAKVIEDVNEIVTAIVTAVEEQSITTTEIVGNVTQASQGISEINENVASSSEMAIDVNEGVKNVKTRSISVKANSEQVSGAATELSTLAKKLTEIVSQFKISKSESNIV